MELQYNHITGQDYAGYNQLGLLTAKQKNGYNSNAWLTYLQAKQSGLQVKKGTHGVGILSPFIKGQKAETKNGKTEIKSANFIPRHYTVFNLDQTEARRPEITETVSIAPELQSVFN